MSEKEFKAVYSADDRDFKKKSEAVAKKGDWLSKKLKTAGAFIAGAFAFGKIVQGIKNLIKANADFEKSLASLSAITGATGKDLEFYGKVAREIGKTSTYAADEAVKAFELMGSARPELLKNKEALAAVTKEAIVLAEASGLDLTTATLSLAKAMNQFNVPASEAGRVINVLAAGSKAGAEAIPGVADAIKSMGTAANMANISLEQSVGMIETLAEKGLVGAESGVMLRNVILMLQAEADKFNPKVVGMNTALDNLADANLSAAELTKMFGIRNQQAAAILIENREVIKKYTDAVTGTNVAYEQQAVLLDTVEAKWKIFKNTLADSTIRGEKFTTSLKNILTSLTDLIGGLQKVTKAETLKWWERLAIQVNQIIPNGVKFTKEQIDALTATQDKASDSVSDLSKGIDKLSENINDGTDTIKKQVDTISDYRFKIEELEASLESLTASEGKRAEQIQNEIGYYNRLIDNILNYKTAIATPAVGIEAPEIPGLIGPDLTELAEIDNYYKTVQDDLNKIQYAYTNAGLAATEFGNQIMTAGIQGVNSMEDFARVAVQVAKRVIAAYVAEAVAGAVKSALIKIPFPFNIAAAGVAGGLAAAAINAAIPEFASGGAVAGPTLALMGEAPGISRSNPEYIGTAAQMAQMGMGGNKILTTRVSRGDLLFILNEGDSHNTKNY